MSPWKTTARLVAAGGLACLLPITFDYLYVRGSERVVAWLSDLRFWKAIWLTASIVAGGGFFVALMDHFGRRRARVLKSAIISAVILSLWFLVANIVVLGFHISIGGRE
jgi:hypothetical protein